MYKLSVTVISFALIVLSGCGGSSSSDSSPTGQETPRSDQLAASTPSKVEQDEQQAVEDLDTPPQRSKMPYFRPLDYPKIDTTPLQYIDSTSGHKIALRVTLPADEEGEPMPGPFPVILVQSAYNTGLLSIMPMPSGALLGAADPFMVRRGYAMVNVDVIGGGASEGGWEMLGAEEQSGYGDVVDWIQQQPWSNGDIGVAGASYMAITGFFTAQQRPDDIKAVFAAVPMGDPKRGTVGIGGLLNATFMARWLSVTHLSSTQNIPSILLNPQHAKTIAGATQMHIDQIDNFYLPIVERSLAGDEEITYDGDFWRVRAPIEQIHKMTAPTMIIGALNDIFQRDEPLLYEALKDRVDTRLLILDGDHVGNFLQAIPGTEKSEPLLHMMLQWFDAHLKGMETGIENIPPVIQYVKGYKPGKWQGLSSTTDWPHPAATPERWYFHGEDEMSRTPPAEEKPARSMFATEFPDYDYGKSKGGGLLRFVIEINDGSDCSPSLVQWTLGFEGILRAPTCFYDTTEIERDALNYETPIMEEDYYVNGPIQADIWMTSTVSDAIVAVRVDEITPKGRAIPITTGMLLASMRTVDESRSRYILGEMVQPYHYFTKEKEQFLVPGEPTKMQIEVFPTSFLVRKGNRLRISISPSNQAMGMAHLARRERIKDGETQILNSPEYPSSVVLLTVPTSELN